jgi:chromatin assembly factor 1 subunit A
VLTEADVTVAGVSGPIDPFSTSYWETPTISSNKPSTSSSSAIATMTPMNPPPPPPPLQARKTPILTTNRIPPTDPTLNPAPNQIPNFGPLHPHPQHPHHPNPQDPRPQQYLHQQQPKKLVPLDQLEAFKRAIEGSDMTKAGLIEVLKKTFPKLGKDHIKNTIDLVAHRVGEKRDDKKWVLKDG